MIRQSILLPAWRWKIVAFYDVTPDTAGEVLYAMDRLGARQELLDKAEANLTSGNYNNGLTYSSGARHESIMAIGRTTTAAEFWNTFTHEEGHVTSHISEARGLDTNGEEKQYLAGEIARRAYPVARQFICKQCLK